MAKIKGTLLLEFVRMIRANKDKDWKKYFTEQNLKLIYGNILPNIWYPIEICERAGEAVFKEIAQGNLELAKAWGKFVVEDMGNRFYHHLVRFQDPVGALQRIKTFLKQWYIFDDPNFQAVDFAQLSPTTVKLTIRYDRPFEFFEPYIYQLAGEFEKIVELNGGKEPKAIIIESDYKSNKPSAVIEVSWK